MTAALKIVEYQYPEGWDTEHADALGVIIEADKAVEGEPRGIDMGEIGIQLSYMGYDARMLFLGRALNELRRWGFIRRLKTGYVPTDKGRAVP